MTSQVLNFMWLNLEIPAPADPADGSIRAPLPEKYIENVRQAGAAHPSAQIVLWVDSKRLTERQLAYLKLSIEGERPNVHLQDLRTIWAYNKEPLYDKAETNPHWRNWNKKSLIWSQVDAAKVLVSLQGYFDQTFFADLDHAHLDIESPQIQSMLGKHGLFIGGTSSSDISIENQLWGRNASRYGFFEQYYATALQSGYKGNNAWHDLEKKVKKELQRGEKIPLKEICLPIAYDGSQAEQPGSAWCAGSGKNTAPALVSKNRLVEMFDRHNKKPEESTPPIAQPGSTFQRASVPKTATM